MTAGLPLPNGGTAHFLSQWSDAVRLSPQLSMSCSERGAHPDTLWQAILQVRQSIKKRVFAIRQVLSPELALDRKQYAAGMLQLRQDQLHTIVWLDARKLWVKTAPHCA